MQKDERMVERFIDLPQVVFLCAERATEERQSDWTKTDFERV